MVVTHADLEPSRRSTELGSKTGAFFIVLTILCGLFCFALCLIAEALRTEVRVGKIMLWPDYMTLFDVKTSVGFWYRLLGWEIPVIDQETKVNMNAYIVVAGKHHCFVLLLHLFY